MKVKAEKNHTRMVEVSIGCRNSDLPLVMRVEEYIARQASVDLNNCRYTSMLWQSDWNVFGFFVVIGPG